MSALYLMRYIGVSGNGAGVLYIGKGAVLGIDIGENRYRGSYTENSGRLQIKGTLNASAAGSNLVTGVSLQAGQSLQVTADWPNDFADGDPKQVYVEGHQVQVALEKLGDVP